MADFTGFTLNGVHSSDLGLVRTSDGSNFSMTLLPTTTDYTSQITGRDGTFYWGRNFKNRTTSINIAFDSVSELQLRRIQQILSKKDPITLKFDESPYKQYTVIPTSNCKIDYVCYSVNTSSNSSIPSIYIPGSDSGTGRVYKGTGSLNFTVLEPYARSTNKFSGSYTAEQLADWNEAIGLRVSTGLDFWYGTTTGGSFIVYNPGDYEASPIVAVNFTDIAASSTLEFYIKQEEEVLTRITLSNIEFIGEDTGLIINSETRLITGNVTGKLYNKYLTYGDVADLHIPSTYNTATKTGWIDYYYINVSGMSITGIPTIEYDYLFL